MNRQRIAVVVGSTALAVVLTSCASGGSSDAPSNALSGGLSGGLLGGHAKPAVATVSTDSAPMTSTAPGGLRPAQAAPAAAAPSSVDGSSVDGSSATPSGMAAPSNAATSIEPSQTRPQGQPSAGLFVGNWFGHGRSLVVRGDGSITIDFRTYSFCTSPGQTGCDRIQGNTIVAGGHVTGFVTRIINPTTVIVTVDSTTVPTSFPPGRFRLGFDRGHDAVAPFAPQFEGVPFCGDRSPVGYCGA